ncbi:uncharacterized protein NFIA_032360 [Aspergillus fischeri NRRL 181]|uniref:Uncharacterized protein n=1 Tax=Neosartorya fischeri (strain ATCC 1020 / DSM 3700 / CBS 544.65 / FGSC A1164 / JCM 1740 / NRRL 181 / WB 181) TaxID=331117 RepID=A1CY52_NEOFI|nr:uncharacterized protein NFIA_032360 [Aspergillus fischeri NRRL 181]EAW23672.1 hypothetical protein NFIA_032360 [Aspergillus fischeri NRRL 181]
MSHDQAPQIWTRAISQYGQITEKALDLASLRELWTVGDLLGTIETENKSFLRGCLYG